MDIKNTILDAIGPTPLVRLNKVVPQGGEGKKAATILAKCEFMNPAGSIKDRMAYHIIDQAEKQGLLKPGGTIVENTSGNTGMGIAMVAAVKGYRCVFTIPDKMSLEKINSLKAFGAEVIITPTDVPGDSPDHYVNVAKRIAAETQNAYYVDQYHSQLNIDAHEKLTGPEIWQQTEGKFDAVVAGVGTGGTISGIGRFIKKQAPKIKVIGADPLGSVHYHYFHTGTMPTPYVYKVEGVGEDIICQAFDTSVVDDVRQVDDRQSFLLARRLVREEGLFCGGSSGTNLHVALQVAEELGAGKTVVVMLPDSGARYITKHLSDAWMHDHGFLQPERRLGYVEDLLRGDRKPVITAKATQTVGELVHMMRDSGVSQIPVTDDGKPHGIVHEIDVLRRLERGDVTDETLISEVANPVGGLIYPKARVEELYSIFEKDQVAVVVDGTGILGVISPIDLIEYMTRRRG